MKKGLFVLAVILFLSGCSGKKNNPTPIPPPVSKPTAAGLSQPAQNSVCTSGTILSAAKSAILFSWNASDNTNSYTLVIKNLLTADSTIRNTAQTQLVDTLLRNTPYSWYVISLSDQTSATAQSPVWKFYNSGPGIVTYAPFPAELTSPTFGQMVSTTTGTINLTWVGSVVAPDVITNYDVYFGTTNSPAILASAITNSFLNNVTVHSATTYYWKVITRDVNGNTSSSELYQFSTD